MGDYSKVIVECTVKVKKEDLEAKVSELGLGVSAYQSEGWATIIKPCNQDPDCEHFDLVLVGQAKYERGVEEFLGWLKPHVIQGSGTGELYAMVISEYEYAPRCFHLRTKESAKDYW